ncbi:hypothetical protein P0D69_03660 [Paraburkholderia sediminicola]|uniref:hypothetical protein n=1 Tax=Paraburkholderia sediminicola TaxID=458836 RepID=UPI0038BBDD66
MVTRFSLAACLCVAQMFLPMNAYASNVSRDTISSNQIRAGCNILFKKSIYEDSHDPLSDPLYSVDLEWTCDSEPPIIVDRYDVEGSSPEVVTVFFRRKRRIVVLVKWSINSQASDFVGDFYTIYVYRFDPKRPKYPFIRQDEIMDKLGSGWDGVKDGRPVKYPLKDAASIVKALTRLGY